MTDRKHYTPRSRNLPLRASRMSSAICPRSPRDEATAVRLASSYLDGPHHRAAFSEAPLC